MPVDKGDLKRGIKVRAAKKRKRGSISISAASTSDDFNVVHQEYGTSKQEAQPYLRPAFHENVANIIEAVKQGIKSRVEKRLDGAL